MGEWRAQDAATVSLLLRFLEQEAAARALAAGIAVARRAGVRRVQPVDEATCRQQLLLVMGGNGRANEDAATEIAQLQSSDDVDEATKPLALPDLGFCDRLLACANALVASRISETYLNYVARQPMRLKLSLIRSLSVEPSSYSDVGRGC